MQVRLGSGEARQGDPMVAWRFSFHMASSRKGSESSDHRSEHHAGFVVLSVGSLPSGSARLSTSQLRHPAVLWLLTGLKLPVQLAGTCRFVPSN